MSQRMARILILLALVVLVSSCRRLDAPGSGRFSREWVQELTALPASWGHLVSASASPDDQDVMLLWFQDGSGNVRMVTYHAVKNQLMNLTLMRRQ
jgi:hypothetical protein